MHQFALWFCFLEVYAPEHAFRRMGTIVLHEPFLYACFLPVTRFMKALHKKSTLIPEYVWFDNDHTREFSGFNLHQIKS